MAASDGDESPDGRNEGALQRADRNLIELLQELRVAQTGVQILFAFLLSLAFTDRFSALDPTQRTTYVVTLLLSVITTGLMIALLEKLGLVWNVVRVSPEKQLAKALRPDRSRAKALATETG